MTTPLVHVLVINWNGREHLTDCFASLLASDYPAVEFVLVDNASTDDSIALVERDFGADPRVAILPLATNRGWSGGNNAGIARAREMGASYIFLLNNDTAVAPDCIRLLVQGMERRPDCGALAPRMLLFDSPTHLNSVGLELSLIGSAWDRGIGQLDGPAWHEEVPVAGVCGGACFLRTRALDDTTLLPEEFGIYLDDLDLCLQLWRGGHAVWTCPAAAVRHKFSATMGVGDGARKKYYLNTRNRLWLVARQFPLGKAWRFLPMVLLGEIRALGRGMLDGAWWKLGLHLRAWIAATAYLPRAWRYRRGTSTARRDAFWFLVRTSPLFCPPLELPPLKGRPTVQWRGE